MEDKKVLFVNHCLTGGGSEKAMTLIANYFAECGMKVTMLLLTEAEKTYKIDARIKLIECYCPIEGNKLLWHIKRIRTIRDAIKKSGTKTIITFMWDINMNVILANVGLGKKIIASERCDPKHETRKLMKFAMNFILPYADYMVFQTEEVRKYYPKKVYAKSCVIPNALSDDIILPNRKQIEKKIVAVGRLTEQKNFSMLINAFYKFSLIHKEYKLIIYGEGPLRKQLEEKVKRLSLSDKVMMPGYISNVDEKMSNAAMYVNCSDYEGISNAMLEALALGIPTICTDCPIGGAKAMISNGINGILIPVGNEDELTNSMKKIVEDEEFATRLTNNAIEIKSTLSIDKIGNKWIQLLEKVNKKRDK